MLIFAEKIMAAKDIYHESVRQALEKDGWLITNDPYRLQVLDSSGYEIDFGAEKIIAATKENQKIAVEVKSFLTGSIAYEFHRALGQFLNYRTFMQIQEKERKLYLAVSTNVYDDFFKQEAITLILNTFNVTLLVFDPIEENIYKWIEK
jgi:hypothetical protein